MGGRKWGKGAWSTTGLCCRRRRRRRKGAWEGGRVGGNRAKGLTAPRVTFNVPESIPYHVAAESEAGAAFVALEDAAEVWVVAG